MCPPLSSEGPSMNGAKALRPGVAWAPQGSSEEVGQVDSGEGPLSPGGGGGHKSLGAATEGVER